MHWMCRHAAAALCWRVIYLFALWAWAVVNAMEWYVNIQSVLLCCDGRVWQARRLPESGLQCKQGSIATRQSKCEPCNAPTSRGSLHDIHAMTWAIPVWLAGGALLWWWGGIQSQQQGQQPE